MTVNVFDPADHPDPTGFIIRALVLTLILLLVNVVLYFYCKVLNTCLHQRTKP